MTTFDTTRQPVTTALLDIVTGRTLAGWYARTGHLVRLDLSEFLGAVTLLWWGLVLSPVMPLAPQPLAAAAIASSLLPLEFWYVTAIASGCVQLIGMAIPWMGLGLPRSRVRMGVLLFSFFWFLSLALGLAFQGSAIAPVVYGGIALQAARNARKAYLNGAG